VLGVGQISRGMPAPFPAFGGALPPEPDDPQLAIPRGALLADPAEPRVQQAIDARTADLATVPADPFDAPPGQRRSGGWTATLAVSCLLHAAAALALLAAGADRILIEGSEDAGLLLLGNAAQDDASAGVRAEDATQVTLVTMLAPHPVETVTDKPVEAIPAETVAALDPLQPAAQDAAEPVEAAPAPSATPDKVEAVEDTPQTAPHADPLPPVLTAQTAAPEHEAAAAPPPDEAGAVAAAPDIVTPEPDRPKPAEKKVASEKPAKKAEKQPEPKKERDKPARKKAAAREKTRAGKPVREAASRAAGSGGSGQADARHGVTGGDAQGTRTEAGKNGTLSAAGNAAVSNYPGKVAAKLKRAARGLSGSSRMRAGNDVRVSFTVTASGDLAGVRIASSSGSPDLDSAALAVVRRAAPFPPIPPEAGRGSWAFTLPLGMLRR